jgi:menaquinone-dependent protoporphyrinogen oxidase
MRIAILYATREGQTLKIAAHLAVLLEARGIDAHVVNVATKVPIELDGYDGAVLAASIHFGKHEKEMIRFVKEHREALAAMPCAFLSVSGSEAGAENSTAPPVTRARSAAEVERMLEGFFVATGWRPQHVLPVAGAVLYRQYNFLLRFVMKSIARMNGGSTDTTADHEYTDWNMLDRFVESFVAQLSKTQRPPIIVRSTEIFMS